ncbi:MAG: transcriptional regulator [Bacteroidales bacterium]|nr:transcriptional regulator [Candidatus Cacconaster scatequi]
MSMNEMVLVSPNVTRAGKWLEGKIIDIEDNPFNGIVITVELSDGNIYWDKEEYFKKIA